jgi:hypothetical protein
VLIDHGDDWCVRTLKQISGELLILTDALTELVMSRCRQPFPSGQRVTYTGKEVLCQKCVQIPVRETQSLQASPSSAGGPGTQAQCFVLSENCITLYPDLMTSAVSLSALYSPQHIIKSD